MGAERLTLTVLGSDGTYPGPGGATSGYLLSHDGTNVWLDAGSGTLANLQRHVSIEEVDAVVLTHEHPDHWSDIEHFAVACRWVIGRSGIPVYSPFGLSSVTRVGSAGDVLEWHGIGPDSKLELGTMRLSFSRTDHPVPTLAVRVEAGSRAFGYSADSGPAWDLESLGPGLDLALCEATFLSDKEGTVQHMSARQAGETARAAGASRLVITHITPRVDREASRAEAAASFGREVAVATIDDRYEI